MAEGSEPRLTLRIIIDGREGTTELEKDVKQITKILQDEIVSARVKGEREAIKRVATLERKRNADAAKAQKTLIEKALKLEVAAIEDANKRKIAGIELQFKLEKERIARLLQLRLKAGKITEDQLKASVEKFDAAFRKVQQRQLADINKSGAQFGSALDGIKRIFLAAGITLGVRELVGLLKQGVKNAIDFERELIAVAKTTGILGSELAELGENILDLSIELGTARSELGEIATVAGQLGIKGVNNISAFTSTVAKLAEVTDLTARDAATLVAQIANVFKIPITEVNRLGSVLNQLENTTVATATDLGDILLRVGDSAPAIGLTVDQVAALGATIRDAGISSRRGGTQLRNLFIKLQLAGAEAAQVAGVTKEAFEEIVTTDALTALQLFFTGLQDLKKLEQTIQIERIFGQEQIPVVQALAGNIDLMNKNLAEAAAELERQTSLNREFARVLTSTSKQFDILKSRISATATRIATQALPTLGAFLRLLNDIGRTAGEITEEIGGLFDSISELDAVQDAIATIEELQDVVRDGEGEQLRYEEALQTVTDAFPEYISLTREARGELVLYTDALKDAVKRERLRAIADQAEGFRDLADRYDDAEKSLARLAIEQDRYIGLLEKGIEFENERTFVGGQDQTIEKTVEVRKELKRVNDEADAAAAEIINLTRRIGGLIDIGRDKALLEEPLIEALVIGKRTRGEATAFVDKLIKQYEELQGVVSQTVEDQGGGKTLISEELLRRAEEALRRLNKFRSDLTADGIKDELQRRLTAIDNEFNQRRIARLKDLDTLLLAGKISTAERKKQEDEINALIRTAQERQIADETARVNERIARRKRQEQKLQDDLAKIKREGDLEFQTDVSNRNLALIKDQLTRQAIAIDETSRLKKIAAQVDFETEKDRIDREITLQEDRDKAKIAAAKEREATISKAELDRINKTEALEKRALAQYERLLEEKTEKIQRFTDAFLSAVERASQFEREFSANEIELQKAEFADQEAALLESLNNREIDLQRYNLEVKRLAEQRADFEKDVEKDKAGFLGALIQDLTQTAITEGLKALSAFIARSIARSIVQKTELAAATAAVVAAMKVIEVQTTSAAFLVNAATFGAGAVAGTAAILAGLATVKAATQSGFAKGGYTGDGAKQKPAGVVHASEYVLTKSQVKNQPAPFNMLAHALDSGLAPKDLSVMLKEMGYGGGRRRVSPRGFGFASGGFVEAGAALSLAPGVLSAPGGQGLSDVHTELVGLRRDTAFLTAVIADDLEKNRVIVAGRREALRLQAAGSEYAELKNSLRRTRKQ